MALTKSYVRAFVRELLDVDSLDIGDTLIDRWMAEAQAKITRTIQHWPFYEHEATLSVLEGETDYTLTAFKEIASVDADNMVGPLSYIDEAQAKAAYWTGGLVRTGYPECWSRWGDVFRIWPEPSLNVTLTITGYRPPTPLGDDAGSSFDLPDDFHEAALEWVLHKAYLHQQDPEMAQIHRNTFDDLNSELTRDQVAHGTSDPIIFGGGIVSPRRPRSFGWRGPTLDDPGWGEF